MTKFFPLPRELWCLTPNPSPRLSLLQLVDRHAAHWQVSYMSYLTNYCGQLNSQVLYCFFGKMTSESQMTYFCAMIYWRYFTVIIFLMHVVSSFMEKETSDPQSSWQGGSEEQHPGRSRDCDPFSLLMMVLTPRGV